MSRPNNDPVKKSVLARPYVLLIELAMLMGKEGHRTQQHFSAKGSALLPCGHRSGVVMDLLKICPPLKFWVLI